MSFIEERSKNTLNNSSSKQLFSFSKTQRFHQDIKQQIVDAFYEQPNKKISKIYSFGKSERVKTEQSRKHSPSNIAFYDIEGDIMKNTRKKFGIKILYGREECKSHSIFRKSSIPGPGAYHPNPQLTQSRIYTDCSIGKELKNKIKSNQIQPGPSSYNIPCSMCNDHKVLSNDMKTTVGRIIYEKTCKSRVNTQAYPKFRFPLITNRGQKMIINNKGFSLGRSSRFNLKHIADEPGPGSYKVFSEFIEQTKK